MTNLAEAIQQELSRNIDLLAEYSALPNGVGFLGVEMLKLRIKRATKALANGNVVEMLVVYEELKASE